MARKAVTLYLDEVAYKRLQELIKPKKISREIDDLIKRRIAELEGREYNPLEEADYEALKREHNRLVREAEKLQRHLKRLKVYSQLLNLMKEDAHQFITLLETICSKRKIARAPVSLH